MSDMKDNNNFEIRIIHEQDNLLNKVLGPSATFLGEQLKKAVQRTVEITLDIIRNTIKFINFRDTKLYSDISVSQLITIETISECKYINPYNSFLNWNWPFVDKYVDADDFLSSNATTVCDKNYFLNLLHQSLSLNKKEKKRVLDSFPDLSQWQVDELIKVFIEEKEAFEQRLEYENDIFQLIFINQIEWAQLLLDSDVIGGETTLTPLIYDPYQRPIFLHYLPWHSLWGMAGRFFLETSRNYPMASYCFAYALRINDLNPYHIRCLAYSYVKRKMFKEAIPILHYMLDNSGANSVSLDGRHLDLAECYLLSGHTNAAKEVLIKFKGIYGKNHKYRYIYDILFIIIDCLEGRIDNNICITEHIQIFLDSNLSTNWAWQDLKRKIQSTDNETISEKLKRELILLLRTLISRQD